MLHNAPNDSPCLTAHEVHALGGKFQPGVRDTEECIYSCRDDGDCAAVDFDQSDSSCWLHAITSACGRLVPQGEVTHYRFKFCEGERGYQRPGGDSQGQVAQADPPSDGGGGALTVGDRDQGGVVGGTMDMVEDPEEDCE